MPEVLYRDEVNKFSVYRLCDIPDGVPRSGWDTIEGWHNVDFINQQGGDRRWLSTFKSRHDFYGSSEVLCAVADEHAGPLLAPRFAVGMRVRVVKSPKIVGTVVGVGANGNIVVDPDGGGARRVCAATEMEPVPSDGCHSAITRDLGAQWGEGPGRHGRGMGGKDSKAWSAHLRFLVNRSEQERRAKEPSVGWDPYGDD